MSLISSILDYLRNDKPTETDTPEGLCPNCWGSQEYAGVVRQMVVDRQIDVNNHQASYAFIQDFVVNHVDGIKLKSGVNGLQCPRCQYTPEG